jgi:hypothetical protein
MFLYRLMAFNQTLFLLRRGGKRLALGCYAGVDPPRQPQDHTRDPTQRSRQKG